ncbi:MAG: hypothetical protein WBZ04_09285 [Candidatus Nanopelagicales bacterium]
MSRARVLPPVGQLLQWRTAGLTQQQMADLINKENRERLGNEFTPVTRSAVSVALSRADKADQRPSYPEDIPWTPIAREHQKDHLLTMLRTGARIKRDDQSVPEAARRRYDNFRSRLQRDDQVVDYNDVDGFHLVERRAGIDDGLIRKPSD